MTFQLDLTRQWEYKASFNPEEAQEKARSRKVKWVNYKGQPLGHDASSITQTAEKHELCDIAFRDTTTFKAGEVHQHITEWESIARPGETHDDMVLGWVRKGVHLNDFIAPYKGRGSKLMITNLGRSPYIGERM